MNKKGVFGLWALASLVAGAVTVLLVGPRKIKEKVAHRRDKGGMKTVELDGPQLSADLDGVPQDVR